MLGNAPGGRNCCRHKFDLLSLDVVSEQLWPKTLLWRSEFRKIVALAIRKKAITIHAAQEIMRKAGGKFRTPRVAVSSDASCDWWQGLIAQPTTASSSLLQTRNAFNW